MNATDEYFSDCALPEGFDSGKEAETQSCPPLYLEVQYTQGFVSDLSQFFVSEQWGAAGADLNIVASEESNGKEEE